MIEEITKPQGPRAEATDLCVAIVRAYAAGVQKAEQSCLAYLDTWAQLGPHIPTRFATMVPSPGAPYGPQAVTLIATNAGHLPLETLEHFAGEVHKIAKAVPIEHVAAGANIAAITILSNLSQSVNKQIAQADAEYIGPLQQFSQYLMASGLSALKWDPRTSQETLLETIETDFVEKTYGKLIGLLNQSATAPGGHAPAPN